MKITKFNRAVEPESLEALVSDNDGTAYSFKKYLPQFAEYLAKHTKKGFLEEYLQKESQLVIGETYNGEKEELVISNSIRLPVSIFVGEGYGSFEEAKSLFKSFYEEILVPSQPEKIFYEILKNNLYKIMVTGDAKDESSLKKFLGKMGIVDYFNHICMIKPENKAQVALEILKKEGIEPSRALFLEDDLEVLKSAKKAGYWTVLRKIEGKKYIPERSEYVDIEVEDDFDELGRLIKEI